MCCCFHATPNAHGVHNTPVMKHNVGVPPLDPTHRAFPRSPAATTASMTRATWTPVTARSQGVTSGTRIVGTRRALGMTRSTTFESRRVAWKLHAWALHSHAHSYNQVSTALRERTTFWENSPSGECCPRRSLGCICTVARTRTRTRNAESAPPVASRFR